MTKMEGRLVSNVINKNVVGFAVTSCIQSHSAHLAMVENLHGYFIPG